jgi:hypothetical protein
MVIYVYDPPRYELDPKTKKISRSYFKILTKLTEIGWTWYGIVGVRSRGGPKPMSESNVVCP